MSKQEGKTEAAQGAKNSPAGIMMYRGGTNPLTLSPFEMFLSNPFSLMRRMTEEMDRAFTEFNASTGDSGVLAPAIDVAQQDGRYVVRADLPGLKLDDVKVEARDGALIIEGERRFEHEEDRGRIHRAERRYGRFYRVVPLPDEANIEKAQAKFENGVLEVTVPVPEQRSHQRQIPVQSAQPPAGPSGQTQSSGRAA